MSSIAPPSTKPGRRIWMMRAFYAGVPLAILLGYAFWAFLPSRTLLPGIGDDPAFNAWHLLYVFRSFDKLTPFSIFSRALWNAPIYAPGRLHLALSENQVWPALILWPVWKITGGLVFTMSLGLFAMHFAAFGAASGWLGARGVREMRFFGGLVFALCGWLQVQYAHWQNGCIFLFPLALWAWERFRKQPGNKQLVICALAFGWVSGWNLYFAVMLMTALAGLLLHAAIKKDVPRARLIALGALAIAFQLPILWRYFELAADLGQIVPWDPHPAGWLSCLTRVARPSLLETLVPWPHGAVQDLEAAGFVGFTWLALALVSLKIRSARWPIAVAAIAYWISLGREHLLYDLLAHFSAFAQLRAVGRFQIAVMAASLPAVFALLESWRGWRRFVPLAMILIELWPATPSERVRIPETIDGPLTPLEVALTDSPTPLLIIDDTTTLLQLAVLRSGARTFEGYSGRTTPTGDLLFEFSQRRHAPIPDLLDLTGATRVIAASNARALEATHTPRLRLKGCYTALDRNVCLFETALPAPEPTVRFAADTETRIEPTTDGIELRLFAKHKGRLDFNALAHCRVAELASWPLYTKRIDVGVEGHSFTGLRFEAGGLVYRKAFTDDWRGWPELFRPRLSAEVSCR